LRGKLSFGRPTHAYVTLGSMQHFTDVPEVSRFWFI
jgi:hypothetical protein